ncbi:MAG TPA: 30S ribosomal protein S6e [Candidatus Aenigmarchaeota archaeon]|nr:MAG: 30S ribosomal protein S6e [Candidatus Aenigmarchaeota archaeon]HDD46128.1 30S ribosomal protein S6e [Candidatus Aenigmarchaeota archaeon]
MVFKVVVSDPKTRKSYQREVDEAKSGLIGKKIGDRVKGDFLGLYGYELEITGGSDRDGFPMRRDVEGSGRKKVLLSSPPGFHPKRKGERKKKTVRGNTISDQIVQINTKVVKYGSKGIEELFGIKVEKEEKKEEKAEEKEKAKIEESKEKASKEEKEESREGAEKKEEKVAEKEGGKEQANDKGGQEKEKGKEVKDKK